MYFLRTLTMEIKGNSIKSIDLKMTSRENTNIQTPIKAQEHADDNCLEKTKPSSSRQASSSTPNYLAAGSST